MTRANRAGDSQPMPTVNGAADVQSAVIADIERRRAVGIERYGTALQPHNGRDALVDAYEEAIDLAMYLKQRLIEDGTETPRPRFAVDSYVVVDWRQSGPWGQIVRVRRVADSWAFIYDVATGSVHDGRFERAQVLLSIGEDRMELADHVLDAREGKRVLR